MEFSEKVNTLRLIFDIIKNNPDQDIKIVQELAEEAKAIIKDLQQYFIVIHLYSDQDLIQNVFVDPSVQYFGMDWNALFSKIDDLKHLTDLYHHQPQNLMENTTQQIILTLKSILGDLNCHMEAIRLNQLGKIPIKN